MARTLTHGARAVRKVNKVELWWGGREKGLITLVVKDVLSRKLHNVAIEILNANDAFPYEKSGNLLDMKGFKVYR